jgi:hypothetical protein
MTTERLRITAIVTALTLFSVLNPALATDFGNPKDIKQIRTLVSESFGKVLNVSVSNNWALCTAYSEEHESDLSVVLHRAGKSWEIKQSDGGAFDKETLKSLGVGSADIPSLLKAYQ